MIVYMETNLTIYKQIIWNSVTSITDLSSHSKMFAVMIYYITGLPTKDETSETTIGNAFFYIQVSLPVKTGLFLCLII